MPETKIACLGAGSMYFAHALADIAATLGLSGSEIALYDIQTEKAKIMAQRGRQLTEQAGTGLRVAACSTLAEAVDGAGFVITSIGGGGASTGGIERSDYHLWDIHIPAKHGIYQLVGDTAGPAGMMMGLRSIPIYLGICREMEKRCPKALLVNHSNPMAVLCRAMIKYTGITVIGICHGVQGGIKSLADLLEVTPEELELVWVGTNHYHWFTRIRHKGQDAYPEIRRRLAARGVPLGAQMTQALSDAYGYQIAYPHDDHIVEFYPYPAQLRSWTEITPGVLARSPGVVTERMAPRLEERRASESDIRRDREAGMQSFRRDVETVPLRDGPPRPLTGESIGSLIEAIACGRREVRIVNIPNQGAVPNLPDYAVLELEGVTDSCGVRPVCAGQAPLALAGMLQKRIAWQELVVDAGVKGDRTLALQALLLDEAAIPPDRSRAMLDELLAASRDLLPQFFGGD